jgi:hypothetical protein
MSRMLVTSFLVTMLCACGRQGSNFTDRTHEANRRHGASQINNATLSQESVSNLINKLFQAPLPASAVDVFGNKTTLFTTVVDIRFSCTKEDFRTFLKSSPVLTNCPSKDNRCVVNTMSSKAWWQPDALTSVMGLNHTWPFGSSTAYCRLMMGNSASGSNVIVYISTTIE